jgi:hypothetical protein
MPAALMIATGSSRSQPSKMPLAANESFLVKGISRKNA